MSGIEIEARTIRKVAWRLMPFLMLGYFIAFVDRVNVGFAALQMNKDLGLSASVFGIGGSLFYVTYVIFEIPSNLALERVGARVWIARILITWGVVSGCTAFVTGQNSFYAMRLLLGAAEAGFFPGIILYLTYWFPDAYRGRIIAMFMVAVPVSSFLGSPISASLLQLDGWLGLHGWQCMFILEALPAVALGILTLFILPSSPAKASWLEPEERAWLASRLALDLQTKQEHAAHLPLWQILSNKSVLAAALIYAGASGASQSLSIWQPQIIKSYGLTTMQTGLLNSIPFGIAAVLMILWGRNSDRMRERIWHTAMPLFLLCASFLVAPLSRQLESTLAILCVAVTATYIVKGPFWALATEWLPAGAAAVGIAQINTIGNVGGIIGTSLLGIVKDYTGSYAVGLLPLALMAGIGCILVISIGLRRHRLQASAA